ncbi:MAG: protein kinase [Gemmatimonadaceae bacterium]|nr:protein kinase [Gemmatimonadaceae bacterium]
MTTSLGIGAVLDGRYEVRQELGAGGMAHVYLARDNRYDRDVAIKVLRTEVAAALGAERFLAEIEMISRLSHPNVLPLYDSGNTAGTLYYVSPYMDGKSLRERLETQGALPLPEIASITREVAHALEYAHGRSIVHRDIKPENILFSGGVAVIADFGIARAVSAAGGVRLTQAGMVLGTPSYMSPEQVAGEQLDARSDVYSLACVVFEMLTGDVPFTGTNAVAVMARHARDPVPSLRVVKPGLPEALDPVLDRALAKLPDDRYPTVREFADALITALGPGPLASRASLMRITAAVAAAAVIGAAGLAIWQRVAEAAPAGPPRVVVLPFDHLGPAEDRFIADGIADEVTSRVAGLSGLAVVARATALHYAGSTDDVAKIAREVNVGYVVTGTVRTDVGADGARRVRVTPHLVRADGQREIWTEQYDASFIPGELFALQSRIAERVAGSLGVTVLLPESLQLAARPTSNAAAYASFLRGNVFSSRRYEEASARQAIEQYQQAVTDDPKFALAWAKLAEALVIYNYYYVDKSATTLTRARDALTRAAAIDSTITELPLARGYVAWWGELNADRALEALNPARVAHPNNSDLLWILAQIERRRGRFADAATTLRRAIAIDPRSHLLALDLSMALLGMRDFPAAAGEADRAMTLAPDWAPAVVIRSLISFAYDGNVDSSRAIVERAVPRVSMREMMKWMYRYPTLAAELGGFVADSALAILPSAEFFDTAKLYLSQGYVWRTRGDSANARASFGAARALLEPRARAATDDAELHALLGFAYAALGQREEARASGDRAMRLMPFSREFVLATTMLLHRLDIALMCGDVDDAYRLATISVRIPSQFTRTLLRTLPAYAPLRTHPGFARLIAQPEQRY